MRLPSQISPSFTRFLGGTIVEIDPATLKVTIQNATGRQESLTVESSDVLTKLDKGDRISVQMDERGRVKKIVKTPDEKEFPM